MLNGSPSECPHSKEIEKLTEIVRTGNGEDSLVARMTATEKENGLLRKDLSALEGVVVGDGETTGLQTHMIRMRTVASIVLVELNLAIAIGGLVYAHLLWKKGP